MPVFRPSGGAGWLLGLTLGSSLLTGGCGDSSSSQTGKTVFMGPQEEQQKTRDLQDAMKGGAYGAAGRKSAKLVGEPK